MAVAAGSTRHALPGRRNSGDHTRAHARLEFGRTQQSDYQLVLLSVVSISRRHRVDHGHCTAWIDRGGTRRRCTRDVCGDGLDASGRRGPARWLAERRRSRSRKAKERADLATSEAELAEAIAAANRICLLEADRPTWIGDRLRVTRLRIAAVYGLDLDSAWARLWLIIPEDTRNELTSARDSFAASTRTTAWGILYVVLAGWWWPALLIGAGILIIGHVRSRSATANLSELIEAVVDLHARELADSIKTAGDTYTNPDVGRQINRFIQKSRWDPTSALAD